jgi:hypothetical protein
MCYLTGIRTTWLCRYVLGVNRLYLLMCLATMLVVLNRRLNVDEKRFSDLVSFQLKSSPSIY